MRRLVDYPAVLPAVVFIGHDLAVGIDAGAHVRKMGRAGLESLTATMKGTRLKTLFGDAGKNFRRPFRKDDNNN